MLPTGEYRRSARISELDARKAQQAKSQNEGNGTINSGRAQGQSSRKISNQNLVRKRKTRPVHDLVDNDVESQVQKAGGDGDHHANAVDMPSIIARPERKMLGLLLDRLKRRDSYKIFAEPVDGAEVEGYYDFIKHPMDFSKINQKLNEGSYKALGEFEYDIALMFNNAMQFNASDTIYYKQAHAMKELANKLFQTLKNDPENFEAACSMRDVGPGRRNKAIGGSLNSNSCNNTTGSRGARGSENLELQPRQSYIPRTSFLPENEFSVTQVYNSSKKFELVKQNKIGYAKSLVRFANNLGPTAQMVTQRKLGSGIAETSKLQTANFNCHLQAPNNFLPSVASALENITTAPSLKLPGNSAGCHRSSGREVDNHSALNVGKTPTVDTIDLYDVLRGGIAQTSTTMKALDEMRGKTVQSPKKTFLGAGSAQKRITVAPSVKLLGNSASRELDIWNGNLSGQKTSLVDTIKNVILQVERSLWVAAQMKNLARYEEKMVQTTGDFDTDTASENPISSSGYEELCFPTEWDTDGNPNGFSFIKLMLDAINTTGVVSSGSKVPDSVPAGHSCPSSSWQWPVQTMPGGSNVSQTIGFIPEVESHNHGGVHQLQAIQEREGPRSSRGSIEQGGQVDWLKLNNNIEGGPSSTHPFGSFQGLDSNYLRGVHQIQLSADRAGPSPGDCMLPGGQVPNWLKPTEVGMSSTQPFSSFQGLGSNYPGGVHQIQPTADKAGPSHGCSMLPGGQVPNWLKPTVLGSSSTQPFSSFQGLDSNYLGGLHPIHPRADKAGPSLGGRMPPGGQVPDWLKPTVLGSSSTQPFSSFQVLDSNYLGGVHQIQPTADKAGPSNGGSKLPGGQFPDWLKPTVLGSDAASTNHVSSTNGEQLSNWFKPKGLGSDAVGTQHDSGTINGGQFLNWYKPTELGPQPITDDWLQQQCRSLTTADLSSEAEPWKQRQQHHWASTPDGSMIKPPNSNVHDNDKGATNGERQLTIGAPTENHQCQSLPCSGFPQLAYHP